MVGAVDQSYICLTALVSHSATFCRSKVKPFQRKIAEVAKIWKTSFELTHRVKVELTPKYIDWP